MGTENQEFRQQKFEATKLEIQAKYGTITPEGQERVTVLQAKMTDLVQRRLDHASRFGHNFANIPISRPDAPSQPVVQTKLTIGEPGDKYEQEADRVAAQVVKQIDAPVSGQGGQNVQREELSEEEKDLQMKPMLQFRLAKGGLSAAPDMEVSIQQAQGSGQFLGKSIREPMEQAMGTDFTRVKVHTDSRANQLNQWLQARAFTTGQDVFFRQGAYEPGSRRGQELLAHELTHVVQQNRGMVQRSPQKTLDQHNTMGELLTSEEVSLDSYLAPLGKKKDLKGDNKIIIDKIPAFNEMLEALAKEEIYKKPFTVTINVGDLEGYGDISAGAKLAKKLKQFVSQFEEWKNVTVKLYLNKIDNLKGKDEQIKRIKDLVKGIIGDSGVHVKDSNEELVKNEVQIAYPAHNEGGDQVIAQYGFNQMDSNEILPDEIKQTNNLGSGPGFGGLGVLSIDDETKQKAKKRVENPVPEESKNLDTLQKFLKTSKIQKTHFAYYSINKDKPKVFATNICKVNVDRIENTAFVYAKSQDNLETIANAIKPILGQRIKEIKTVEIKDGKITEEKTHTEGTGNLIILLVDFPEGVQNIDMLSLYYKSDDVVGATGDQSFLEAYEMRRMKNEDNPKQATSLPSLPDIYYDVQEHQIGLHKQILELEEGKYRNQGSPRMVEINVNDNVSNVMDKKLLQYPIIMLINKLLNVKSKEENDNN